MKSFVVLFLLLFSAHAVAFSAPKGFHLVKGSAKKPSERVSGVITIKSDQDSIIHWDHFSIDPGEMVCFDQAHAKLTILNRVCGSAGSEILGSLLSNGSVYLINPHGVLIGPHARIEAASFVASTADVLDEDFLRGKELLFANSGEGSITNLGKVSCPFGDIILIAKNVKNEGILQANGLVALASGSEVLLKPDEAERIFIRPELTSVDEETAIENHGAIYGLTVELKTTNPYEKAIRQSGRIEATKVQEKGGRIYLLADKGGLSIEGELLARSGDVSVLGQEILLTAEASIDVSGPQAGQILIGGDYQGSNPSISNSQKVYVDYGAEIRADSSEGDAGRVIIWSDGTTEFYGHITAQALGETGKGGFAEVSGLLNMRIDDHPNLKSYNDKDGLLLLDPGTVNIVNGPNLPPLAMSTFNDAWIENQLQHSASIIISTSNSMVGVNETLNVASAAMINWTSANDLTLTGRRNVDMNASTITATAGNITINANTSSVTRNIPIALELNGATVSTTTGHLTMTATGGTTNNDRAIRIRGGSTVSTTEGNMTLTGTGTTGNNSNGIRIEAASTLSTTSGTMTLTGIGGLGSGAEGIRMLNGASCSTTDGTMILNGSGGMGNNADGIRMQSSSSCTTTSGSVTLIGNAGTEGRGVRLQSGAFLSTIRGAISVTGTGGTTPDNNGVGIQLNGNATHITAVDGSILLDGTGGVNGNNNQGIRIINSRISSTGVGASAATISLTGVGGSGTTGCRGIFIDNGDIDSFDGNITLIGTGTGTGNTNAGIHVEDNGTIRSMGIGADAATINMTGLGSLNSTTGGGVGINIEDAGTRITSVDGLIMMTGTGRGSGGSVQGILVQGGADISSIGTAGITLDGTGSSIGGDNNHGVYVTGGNSLITTLNGAISITGRGGGVGDNNDGIRVDAGGMVTSTGLSGMGTITFMGTGGTLGDNNRGVNIDGSITSVSTATGNLTFNGESGGTGSGNAGIRFGSGGSVVSTDTGTITLTGAGHVGVSGNHGILVEDMGSLITSTLTGSISIMGTGNGLGGTNAGIYINGGGAIRSIGSGIITAAGVGATPGPDSWGMRITGPGSHITSTGTGTIDLTGTATGGTNEGILVELGGTVQSSIAAPIVMRTFSDLIIQDGGNVTSLGTGAVTMFVTRDLSILGGAGAGAAAFVSLADGMGTFTVGRDLNLIGGTGLGANAQIGNNGGVALVASAPMTFTIGNDVNIHSLDTNSFAVIGHGDPTTAQTLSGAITFTSVGNDIILTGAPIAVVGPRGFAQIGHVNAAAGGSTLSGNISLTADNNINLIGGAAATSAYARIGHGGQAGAATFGASTMLLIAGADIDFTSTAAGLAQVVNSSAIPGDDTLTLVVDNLFPVFPGIGLGAFNFGADSVLTALGELRIYTARQSQNSINGLINGFAYSMGMIGVNDEMHQWDMYFPSGTYGGLAFNFYFKEGRVIPPSVCGSGVGQFFENVMANLTALNNLLPILWNKRLGFRTFPYHLKVCEEFNLKDSLQKRTRKCEPAFSPYGSFIFEDDLYWIPQNSGL